MTQQEFDTILEARIAQIRQTLQVKAREYTPDGDKSDRLHNFKRASTIHGTQSSGQVCVGFMLKHLASLFDLTDDMAEGIRCERWHLLDEKLGDAINYMILLEAVLKEDGEHLKYAPENSR